VSSPNWSLGAGLADRTVLVTGAASGIGRSVALALDQLEANVVAIDRDSHGLEALEGSLEGDGHRMVPFDLADTHEIEAMVGRIAEESGGIWGLTAAAAHLRRQDLKEVTEADWDAQLDVNLKATFFLNRSAAAAMKAAGKGGRIVNFSSASWQSGAWLGSDVYVAAKAGVIGLTRNFARSLGPHNITVNVISPGQIDTPLQHQDSRPEVTEAGIAACPLGRLGTPKEVAAVVVFLLSEHAGFVSGATINVSGALFMY